MSLFSRYNGRGKDQSSLKQANYVFQTQPKGMKFLKGSFCQGISKGDGPKWDSWPWGPVAFLQIHLLPIVWEKRSEWGDHHKPPKNGALQIGLHMRQVLWLSYNYIGHSPQAWLHHLCRLGHCLPGGHSACPHGLHLGNFILTDPLPHEGHNLKWEKGIDCHSSNSILWSRLHQTNTLYHSWHKAIKSVPWRWQRTMNTNTKQANNNSLNIKWSFNNYNTKVFC